MTQLGQAANPINRSLEFLSFLIFLAAFYPRTKNLQERVQHSLKKKPVVEQRELKNTTSTIISNSSKQNASNASVAAVKDYEVFCRDFDLTVIKPRLERIANSRASMARYGRVSPYRHLTFMPKEVVLYIALD